MARDPAFLFYDGDAARDVSHMNRLERGAYFDIIQAQRKFYGNTAEQQCLYRGITVEQLRKILGRDFDSCWPSIELILEKDQNGNYSIPWLTESLKKRSNHAESQRKRIQDYWDNKKKGVIPRNNHGNTGVYTGNHTKSIPLEDEDENEDCSSFLNFFNRFKKSYPPNGSQIGINAEKALARSLSRGNDPELIILRASDYAQYQKDELGEKYPYGKYVANADNWLDGEQQNIDWSKKERSEKAVSKSEFKKNSGYAYRGIVRD